MIRDAIKQNDLQRMEVIGGLVDLAINNIFSGYNCENIET